MTTEGPISCKDFYLSKYPMGYIDLFWEPKFAWWPTWVTPLDLNMAAPPEFGTQEYYRWVDAERKFIWLQLYFRRKYRVRYARVHQVGNKWHTTWIETIGYAKMEYMGDGNGLVGLVRRQWDRLRHSWA